MPSPETLALDSGWEAAATDPDAFAAPDELTALDWLPAAVPGTAAGALRAAGRWSAGDDRDFDAQDWWFRVRFDAEPAAPGETVTLHLGGLATVAEVHLNGELLLRSESMYAAHPVDVGARLRGDNELAIRCLALGPMLAVPRKPRARWRQKVVDGNLRWFRTMLLGRAPGFAPRPAAVGPWRPVVVERTSGPRLEALEIRPSLRGDDGVLALSVRCEAPVRAILSGPTGRVEAGGSGAWSAELVLPRAARWWPHTHGEPALHDLRIETAGGELLAQRRVGFRDLAPGPAPGHDVERDGLDLHVNGVRVFARGAVWTPVDPVGMAPDAAALRTALEQVRDAGMNIVRVVGTAAYEEPAFHDLCDELGILVWQDLMFANLDYPIADEGFRSTVEAEARDVLARIAGRPSTAVVCGNSEVEQQVAMLGLDPALGRGELFGDLLPALVAQSGCDAAYVPSAPCGGDLPFRTNAGVANYFGVGGYRRPLEDARRAEVRFASECLAIANVPDDATLGDVLPAAGDLFDDPRWKAGVPSDNDTDWDFDDVRDHYLALLVGSDPAQLRRSDPSRYLALSRQVSGEVMAEVFGEWRRAGSPCGGGIVLWLRDLVPGAGWGLVDAAGRPKVAWHHVRRALAPVAVWTTDEGQNGIAVHVANDGPEPVTARLRVSFHRDGEHCVADGCETLALPAHGAATRDAEALVGRFVDAAYAFRFGPPGHDVVVATLEEPGEAGAIISQAFRFPVGRPTVEDGPEALGLHAAAVPAADGSIAVTVGARRLAWGVRVAAPGFVPDDDAFSVAPGGTRVVVLRPCTPGTALRTASLTALNLRGSIAIPVE